MAPHDSFRHPPRRPLRGRVRVVQVGVALALLLLAFPLRAAERPQAPPTLTARSARVQLLDPAGASAGALPGSGTAEGAATAGGPTEGAAAPVLPEPWLVHGDTGKRSIASISKLFALMAILDRNPDMDGTTTIEPSDRTFTRGGARSRLRVGLSYRNRDLVTAALMSSDNRAPLALGRAVGLDRTALAKAMVAKARSIGLRRVSFEEPVGLSYENQASAEGLVLALRAALEYPAIREVTSTPDAVITPAGRKAPRERYVNTNRLVRWGFRGILGGKTGFNREAGHCLAFAVQLEDGRRAAIVILGAPDRGALFRDAKKLYEWTRKEAKLRPPETAAAE